MTKKFNRDELKTFHEVLDAAIKHGMVSRGYFTEILNNTEYSEVFNALRVSANDLMQEGFGIERYKQLDKLVAALPKRCQDQFPKDTGIYRINDRGDYVSEETFLSVFSSDKEAIWWIEVSNRETTQSDLKFLIDTINSEDPEKDWNSTEAVNALIFYTESDGSEYEEWLEEQGLDE
jgi:hypothetical protein